MYHQVLCSMVINFHLKVLVNNIRKIKIIYRYENTLKAYFVFMLTVPCHT